MKLRINRETVYKAFLFYIISFFSFIFLIMSYLDFIGIGFDELISFPIRYCLLLPIVIFYTPLMIFLLFIKDAPLGITIPGLISMVVISYIILGKIDFEIHLPFLE